MSSILFEELAVPAPDHRLGVGQGTHAQQAARVMERLEPLRQQIQPELIQAAERVVDVMEDFLGREGE